MKLLRSRHVADAVRWAIPGITVELANQVVDIVNQSRVDALKSGSGVVLEGVGKLVVVMRKARKGYNPKLGVRVDIPAQPRVKFIPDATLRDLPVSGSPVLGQPDNL